MNFSITPNLKQQNNFLVKWSEISGKRWNPSFYNGTEKVIDTIKLGTLISIKGGKRIPKGMSFSSIKTEYKYLRVENLNDFSIDYESTKDLSEEIFNILKRYELNNGDLIISIAGTIGKIGLFESDGKNKYILTENCAKIIIKSKTILSKYLAIILRSEYMQEQINQSYIKTTIPKLGLDRVLNLEIPVPPSIRDQEKIIALMDNAYKNKINCEQKAKELLDGIDEYLLEELGIELPEELENSLKNRQFQRKWSELSGSRWDGKAHFSKLSWHTNKYPTVNVLNVVTINPPTSALEIKQHKEITFIPMKNILNDGNGIDKLETIPTTGMKGYTLFRENDLIWAKITPCMENGKNAVAKKLLNAFGAGSTEYHVFRSIDEKILDIDYLQLLFNLKVVRKYAKSYFIGSAGHQRVSEEFFVALSIPLPLLSVQTDLVKDIAKIKEEAKDIINKGEANLIIEQEKIHKMIIGEQYE